MGFVHLLPQGHIVRFPLSMPMHILGYWTGPARSPLLPGSGQGRSCGCTCNSEGPLGKQGEGKAGLVGRAARVLQFCCQGLWARMASYGQFQSPFRSGFRRRQNPGSRLPGMGLWGWACGDGLLLPTGGTDAFWIPFPSGPGNSVSKL